MAKKTERPKAGGERNKKTTEKRPLPDIDPLFVPHLDKIRGLSKNLLELPEGGDEYPAILESICGADDDSQPVEQYDGTLGVTIAFVNAHQAPVGQLQWNDNLASIYTNPGTVSGERWCSGTMITNNLFLAAGHCFDQTGGGWVRPLVNGTTNIIPPSEIATNMHVNFNYQVNSSGILQTEQSFAVLELVEYRLGGLDFAIVRLDGNPGVTYGTTQVSATDGVVGETICIIGHPAGQPKRIEAGAVLNLVGNYIGYNDIDTLGGNSGSGILRASDGRIVGVHTNGGCNAAGTGHNTGVRITSIIAQSPTLQSITTVPKMKFSDDGVTIKFADDGGKLKNLDDVKMFGLDKMFGDHKMAGMDAHGFDPRIPRWKFGTGRFQGGRPFIMATPHHSMAWAGRQTGMGMEGQDLLAQYETALMQMEQLLQQGMSELKNLDEQYQLLLAEYQALSTGKM